VRWKRVAGVAAVLALAAVPWWGRLALRPFSFFAVRRVELVGVRYLAPATVMAALGLEREASVWDRLAPLESRLGELPGVAEVSVARRLPETLVVTVREVEPVALAAGRGAVVPVGVDGRPLPYDAARAPVDAPVVQRPDTALLAALAVVGDVDPELFARISTARWGPNGSAELEMEGGGLLRLAVPLDPGTVRSVAAVQRDLGARSQGWRELDGRFAGWVVVRRALRSEVSS